MKKIIVTGMVALMLLIPVSANAETPAEQIAKAQAQAETISKNVEALRVKTTVQFQLIQKQITALTKLVKTLA